MRDALIAHGGTPTELEKVNWIKMRMYVRDADALHTELNARGANVQG
jgi:hypothetical protein